MQPEVMLFMFGIVLITIKIVIMSIEHWRDIDRGEE